MRRTCLVHSRFDFTKGRSCKTCLWNGRGALNIHWEDPVRYLISVPRDQRLVVSERWYPKSIQRKPLSIRLRRIWLFRSKPRMGLYNHERVWNACGWMICYLAFVRQIRCDFPRPRKWMTSYLPAGYGPHESKSPTTVSRRTVSAPSTAVWGEPNDRVPLGLNGAVRAKHHLDACQDQERSKRQHDPVVLEKRRTGGDEDPTE